MYDNVGEELFGNTLYIHFIFLGCSAQELRVIKERNNENYREKLNENLWSEFKFIIQSSNETYRDNTTVKHIVKSIQT